MKLVKHLIAVTIFVIVNLVSQANATDGVNMESDISTIREMAVLSGMGSGSSSGPLFDSIHAFRRIVKAKNARKIFGDLLKEATPEGQMYALCGLFFTAKETFSAAVATYESSTQKLNRQEGCVTFTDTVGELIQSQRGVVMKLNSGESTERWFIEHPEYGQGGFIGDISGGGFCHEINGTLWPTKFNQRH